MGSVAVAAQAAHSVMAYSPIERASLARNPKLAEFARSQGMTPAQAALAWLLAKDDIIAIPKTAHRERLKENAARSS